MNRYHESMEHCAPPPELEERAAYITEMKKHKHPFDAGLPAREGVEW